MNTRGKKRPGGLLSERYLDARRWSFRGFLLAFGGPLSLLLMVGLLNGAAVAASVAAFLFGFVALFVLINDAITIASGSESLSKAYVGWLLISALAVLALIATGVYMIYMLTPALALLIALAVRVVRH